MLLENLEKVEERIARAVQRAGRKRDEITLIAVTKVFPVAALIDAYGAGLREFGENYVQEFEGKFPQVSQLEGARFHLIGHLQSNKSKKAGEMFQVIQTVDSVKLARRLDELNLPLEVMIEVKLADEDAKYGAAPEDLPDIVDEIIDSKNLRMRGLMTMPPWDENPEAPRPYFRRLRGLAEHFGIKNLSMGMSNDFETAIEEGATHIRVGTAIFGKRQKK